MPQDDTIAAIATPPGSGGIAVARLSGPDSWVIAERLLPPARLPLAAHSPGTFFHTSVRHPVTREKLDDAIVLLFRAPKSYTGEDVVEFQGHGGGMQSSRLLDALLAAGARLANPGEFTQRAFLNGRIDSTQAEAVCDLIQSRSESAARLARAQLDGSLGSEFNALYDALVAVAADIEHVLDFDEGELPPPPPPPRRPIAARRGAGGDLRRTERWEIFADERSAAPKPGHSQCSSRYHPRRD